MKLTNGKDTIILTNEIQIKAYLSSGYTEVEDSAECAEAEDKSKTNRKKG